MQARRSPHLEGAILSLVLAGFASGCGDDDDSPQQHGSGGSASGGAGGAPAGGAGSSGGSKSGGSGGTTGGAGGVSAGGGGTSTISGGSTGSGGTFSGTGGAPPGTGGAETGGTPGGDAGACKYDVPSSDAGAACIASVCRSDDGYELRVSAEDGFYVGALGWVLVTCNAQFARYEHVQGSGTSLSYPLSASEFAALRDRTPVSVYYGSPGDRPGSWPRQYGCGTLVLSSPPACPR